jgi:tRNA G18 (ribose-2'-O)-methylase SpoU
MQAMGQVIRVDAVDDPRLAPFTRLTDAEHRRAVDAITGTFLVEGVTAIRRALASPYAIRSVLVTPGKAAVLGDELRSTGFDVFVADQTVMNAVTGFDIHRGAVALAERRPLQLLADVVRDARALAVLEGLTDHENLGAVARSAHALGVDGLVLDPTCADPLYRRCVRVSMGEILHLPFARAEPWPTALDELKAAGFTVVALTPGDAAEPIDAVAEVLGGQRVALLLGAEGPGLSPGALAAADHCARIPIRPGVDSLNVGHAAAIAFYAVSRHLGAERG